MLPCNCPDCRAEMSTGFLYGGEEGEELIYWNQSYPRESIERPLALQKTPVVRSFRLSSLQAEPLEARRCERCKLVIFRYIDPSDIS